MKVKNASAETKSKRLLDQKVKALEEKGKKATKNAENLEAELKSVKVLLSEKEKELDKLQVSLDHALCEKQEFQYRYEATEESFQTYQSHTTTNQDILQKELGNIKEELEKAQNEHKQQVLQLQTVLDKTKESLNSSNIAYEKQLQETTKALHKEHNTFLAEQQVSFFLFQHCKLLVRKYMHNFVRCNMSSRFFYSLLVLVICPTNVTGQCNFQKEVATLRATVESITSELEQAKKDASDAVKDKLQIKLESDNKVKVRLVHTHTWFTRIVVSILGL